jgi:hypothetical protein
MSVDALQKRKALVPLGPWIDLAQRAKVPHIPAAFSTPFPLIQAWQALDGEATPELDAAMQWARCEADSLRGWDSAKPYLRWEDCSPGETKWLLGKGGGYRPEYGRLPMLDDPRLSDCALTDPQRLVVRPWVDALMMDGYPVEFRVFVERGLKGVSSYYPQRPLPETAQMLEWAAQSGFLALKLQGEAPRRWAGAAVGFTADFLVSAYGNVLFLEGGPPHTLDGLVSAHPCCFAPRQISGIALTPREGALRS